MDKNLINVRFIEAVNYLLINNKVKSKGEMAESLNISNSKFSEILNGRMNVGTDTVALFCYKYDINTDWLLIGRGEMFHEATKQQILLSQITESDLISIPIVDISIAAGVNGYENPCNIEVVDSIKMPGHMLVIKPIIVRGYEGKVCHRLCLIVLMLFYDFWIKVNGVT